MISRPTEERIAHFQTLSHDIRAELGKVIVGQKAVVDNVLICLLAGGHVLLEGVPGLGKTELVKTLGEVLDLRYGRVQFTPDLMPADITGTTVISEDQQDNRFFRFEQGPIFNNLVLADEINRATPKTQSALLEAMHERTVTVGNSLHDLPIPFFVMATQNPIEMEGTYPLPEAQLDRFFFKIIVNYPMRRNWRRSCSGPLRTRCRKSARWRRRETFWGCRCSCARCLSLHTCFATPCA